MKAQKKKGTQKSFASKRTMNPTGGAGQAAHADTRRFQQHDAAGRQGSFEGTGNHARTGNRGHQ